MDVYSCMEGEEIGYLEIDSIQSPGNHKTLYELILHHSQSQSPLNLHSVINDFKLWV